MTSVGSRKPRRAVNRWVSCPSKPLILFGLTRCATAEFGPLAGEAFSRRAAGVSPDKVARQRVLRNAAHMLWLRQRSTLASIFAAWCEDTAIASRHRALSGAGQRTRSRSSRRTPESVRSRRAPRGARDRRSPPRGRPPRRRTRSGRASATLAGRDGTRTAQAELDVEALAAQINEVNDRHEQLLSDGGLREVYIQTAAPAAGGVAFARLSLTAWLATMYEGFTRSYQASAASPDQWTFVRWMTQTSSRVVQMEEFYDRMHDKQWLLVPRREAAEQFVEAMVSCTPRTSRVVRKC